MSLSKVVGSHHTVWVTVEGRRPVALRYATTPEALVCFGDDGLAAVADGARVVASVHEIVGGPPLDTFGATLRDLRPADVPLALVSDLVGNRSYGAGDSTAGLAHERETCRIVELRP